ncbi:Uncharacterized protein containing double-stranded beta helix domain [Legionella wadsworthii]|uniref:Uncharacterized protein containing double-stranded beta helix domain n=1 Tax=Legionella wadsworthii TaxID=28088 RepID=A0A378LVT4_9GAMM|nr:cupin domain-containing protein [Legionella wadsworthii]STY31732.1 Uncharacterized protein containing double-stranded beta helix domain [Legionella wadsworthii]
MQKDIHVSHPPKKIIHEVLSKNGFIPNNPRFPLLIYKQAITRSNEPKSIQEHLQRNHWGKSWVDSIYDCHHYHSNTHEVLVMIEGEGTVQFGGEQGTTYEVSEGDVVIIPAGVAHKSLSLSKDFKCIGAYAANVEYDMNYGKAEEHPRVDEQIQQVGLPKCDPVFGNQGLLFDYWK